ncbi:MAG: DNA mismatch repair protein MutS [Clostridia bacterium]|nr:DNA mismatch repair protein MutS [Clostridia bacterium]
MAEQNGKTDMMKHYLTVKERYPDCIVFYRLGDFYEMFFEDAVEASTILNLTLTGRSCGEKERAPMCGVPYHAADSYIAQLVSHGKKVAICEQLSDPKASKGLVDRDVIRVVTGGTITDDSYVDEKKANYVLCAYKIGGVCAFSWADITTGEFVCQRLSDKNGIIDALSRINPAEIISNNAFFKEYELLPEALKNGYGNISLYNERAFDGKRAAESLCEQFKIADLSAFSPEDNQIALNCAGALIAYLKETQMHALSNINNLRFYDEGKYLRLDSTAVRNLEVVSSMRDGKEYGTLLWAVDKTKTAGGGRRLRQMLLSPLRDIKAINYRQEGVEDLFSDNVARESVSETLRSVKDLSRLCGRISNGIVSPRDCLAIMQTLDTVPSLKFQISGMNSAIIRNIFNDLTDFSTLANLIRSIIKDNPPILTKDGGFVKDGFDEKLDHYRSIERNARDIIKEMEERERSSTGIRTLKIGFNKVFGYYIEVSKSFVDQVPHTYVRKQTLVGGERYITEELKKFEEEVLSANENIIRIENEIFKKLVGILVENLDGMIKLAKALSSLDVLCSFAIVARENGYVRPTIVGSDRPLNIVDGRHPVVEKNSKIRFVSNDTYLDCGENSMMIITGPNMAGKSTYMRQVALISLLAHTGSFVPAKEAEIPIIDRIFTRVGASDNIMFDQSTFMVEMTEVANVLRNATASSLVILDEVGRGTSTYDGLSIAWAVVEYLTAQNKVKTLFATHYHELSELENSLEGVKNYKVTVKEVNGEIVFLRKIRRGSANKSFGIEVASLAGVPKAVTEKAKTVLDSLEKNDLALKAAKSEEEEEERQPNGYSFVEEYLDNLDLNNITPLKAFEILTFLKGKTNGDN